ncbi:MAG: PAS domain S-box protein [Bacteroidetes bacterium]|nr:MAG: PAS domain S-box protein [Bacteroidota bacterium]
MPDKQYANLLLDQTNDLIWAVGHHFCLVYANKAYLNLMKAVTGKEKKLNEQVFVEGFGDGYIEKWKAYYERGLNGEHFEIVEHFYNPNTNQVEYSQITFNPIIDENKVVVNVACQSRDITSFVKSNTEAEVIMDASLDVICKIDEQGFFTNVSAACIELWGYEKHELVGKAFIDFVIEEDKEKTNEVTNEILNGKTLTIFENRYKRKDGGIAFNLWSVRYDPKSKNLIGIARDAREKIQKEELLIESENRFKALVQEGSDLIGILDETGIYTYVSPTSIGILGIEPEEFIGKSPFDYIHPEDVEKTQNSLNKIILESRVEVEPFRFKNKDGEWRWIETVLTNMLSNPAIKGIVANSRDITAKKKETQHLKLLESVITNTKDAVLITEAEPMDDPGPRILYVNEAFTRMTGYTADEVIGKSPRILQGPNSDKAELERLSKALRNWESCEITTLNYKKNGDEFWINFSVSPVADETGWYTHWIAVERDVTESKKLELSISLTSKISKIFKVEPDLFSTLSKLCEEVAFFGQFSFCEIWMTDIQEKLLELKAVYKKDKAATIFYENSIVDTILQKGQGLQGKVWENVKPIIWEYKGKNQDLLIRSKAAEEAGIKTIVGLPLMYHDKFIGVFQFGTQAITKNVDWIINVFEKLGVFIGAEIARKKTEIELTKIFEFAPDIIITVGLDGYIRSVNPYTCKLLGYTEKELISKPFTNYLYPADTEISLAELKKLSYGTPIHNFINRNLTKTGAIKTISWNCSPSVEDGLIFCIGKDITEEVKVASLLKESNQLSRIGSWEVDLINNTLFWSDITHEIHETPENYKPLLNEAINFYREDFRELVTEAVNACIETGTPFDFEAIIVTTKKNEVWVRSIGRAEMINGQCIRIFGSFQDIHERKVAELRLHSLADNLPGVVFQYLLYPDGTDVLRNVTKGAYEIWEYSPEEVMVNIDLVWSQTRSGGDYEQVQQSIKESVKTKTKWVSRYKSVAPSGKIRTLLGTGTPDFLADGTVCFNSVVLDITKEAQNEVLLNEVSEIARIGSWEVDLINKSLFWSKITHEIHETPGNFKPNLSEAINFYHEDFRALVSKAVNECIETGTPFDFEAIIVTINNNERWVRAIGNAELINGQCKRIYGSIQDIHASKSLEIQIREILESISDYFYALDGELNFTYMNSSCASLLAVNKENIIGKNLFTEFPDLKNTQFEDELRKVKITAEATKFEFYYAPFDAWFEESIYPTPTGISVYFADITQSKKAHEEITKSEEKRRLIMNGALDAIISIDTNEKITFWNPQAEVIFGWKAEEVMGKPLSEMIIPEPFRKYHVEGIKNYLNTGEGKYLNALLELSAIRKNGEEFPIELTVLPIKQGGEEFFCAFVRDITQRKKSEENLLIAYQEREKLIDDMTQRNRDLEQFTFIISHNLRAPTANIIGFAEVLQDETLTPPEKKEFLHGLSTSVSRLDTIIKDINSILQVKREVNEKKELIYFSKLVNDIIISIGNIIDKHQVRINTDFSEIDEIFSLKIYMHSIFYNLISNSIKYSKPDEPPLIQIKSKIENGKIILTFKDNGLGIDMKTKGNKVFGLYKRFHSHVEGKGMGLFMVKTQVEAIGGKITVASELNKGTEFTIVFDN